MKVGLLAMLLACGSDATGPEPAPEVVVAPAFLNLVLGATRQLSVTVFDDRGQVVPNPPLTFTTSDATRVTVSAIGLLTAVAPGDAAVTVSTHAASAYVGVRALSPPQIHVSPGTVSVTIGDTVVFTAQALDFAGAPVPGAPLTFESGNPAVVAVIGPQGRVHAVGLGAAWVRVHSGTTADSARMTVYGPATSVIITPDSLRLLVADDAPLAVEVRDVAGTVLPNVPVSFVSADTLVARVSGAGLVRAVGVGLTTITAVSGAASASVPIVAAAEVSLTPSSVMLTAADTIQLVAVARDAGGAPIPGVAFTFSTTDPTIARVSPTGVLTYAGPGAAAIIAEGGFDRDTSLVTVLTARIPLPARAYSAAVSTADAVYVTGHDPAFLFRLDPVSWTLTTSLSVGSEPTDVTFNGAGTRAYVTNQLSQSISEVDPATDTELRQIPLPADPFVVVVAPGDSILYVSANSGRVYVVHVPTGTVRDSIATGIVNALLIQDTVLYMGLPGDGAVREYDIRGNLLIRTLATGGTPQGLALSLDGSQLYVADEQGGLQFWDVPSGARLATLPLSWGPFDVAVQPGTGRAFVSAPFQGAVAVIDPLTRTLERTYVLGGTPRRIAFRANGDAVVANEDRWVDIVR